MLPMRFRIFLIFILSISITNAQEVSIEQVYNWAKQNYPVYKQKEILKQKTSLQLNNTQKAYLPQVGINGQATYQSDVTKIPIQLPNMDMEEMSQDQYRVVAEINQLIYDGGEIKNQQEKLLLSELIQNQEIEVDLYTLRQRVSDLCFGVLLLDKQISQRRYLEDNIQSALEKSEVALENGITYRSTVYELKAELISSQQQRIEIEYNKMALFAMLSDLTGQKFSDTTQFKVPQDLVVGKEIQRPEMDLLSMKKQMIELDLKNLKQHWYPKVSAFVQGGYGRPGLNMLDNNFQAFAIGGVRFSMPLSGFYTHKNKLEIKELESEMIDTELASFKLLTKISEQKEIIDIQKYDLLIEKDQEIIDLRKEVLKSAESQLAHGVITSHEYINKLNATYLAQITKDLHQLQRIKAIYQQQIITGNQ